MSSSSDFNHIEWYDRIAERTGGYRKTWRSVIEGRSGEDAFAELLFDLLEPEMHVLDAGCGSGEFSLEVARKVEMLIGFDFAGKMIAAASENAETTGAQNIEFVHAATRSLPFTHESFDLVYSRRGPTSILLHPDLLKTGGWMFGIHSGRLEVVRERLVNSGLVETAVEEFGAREVFDSLGDFTAYWSRMPGHPDYTAPENEPALLELIAEHDDNGVLSVPQYRFIWWGKRG